jgi:hypothetical protein
MLFVRDKLECCDSIKKIRNIRFSETAWNLLSGELLLGFR